MTQHDVNSDLPGVTERGHTSVLSDRYPLERAIALADDLPGLSVVIVVNEQDESRVVAAMRRPPSGESLTPREMDVVRAAARGCSNRQIARSLGIAEQTVKNHLHHVLNKLGLSSRTELCRWEILHSAREPLLQGEEPAS